jgi:phosphoribosylaminoimidazole-succinocarboxamide synthase
VEEYFYAAGRVWVVTSVKEFRVTKPATATAVGRGRFVFTDDYSVFDWGQMPDTIPGKGASLCLMGAHNFELLDDHGVPTHYRGVVGGRDPEGRGTERRDPEGRDTARRLAAQQTPPREMEIDLVSVPELPYVGAENGYDYDAFYDAVGDNYLVPLEIVFRNAVPVGSSLRRRRSPREVGLDRGAWPDEPVTLPEPVVEFSTKFEERDRYLSREEADRLAGRVTVDRLTELALTVNEVVTERAETAGFTHEDGKIECYYADGEVGVADVVGTFDENRFSYDGQQVSKEVVRQYYKRAHPEWVEAVSAAKERADREGVADWRPLCEQTPPSLPDDVVATVADLYAAGANAYCGGDPTASEWFDAPTLATAVDAVREL